MQPDAELEHIKARYRPEVDEALRAALAGLSSRDRNLLRLYVLDELSMEEIGKLYGVHHTTVSRRLLRLRQAVIDGASAALSDRLQGEAFWGEPNAVAGSDAAVSDGTFLLLRPLRQGSHTIRFQATAGDSFALDITYHLRVR